MDIADIPTPTQNIIFLVFLFFAPRDPPAVPTPAKAARPATHAPQKGSLISAILLSERFFYLSKSGMNLPFRRATTILLSDVFRGFGIWIYLNSISFRKGSL